MPDEQPGNNAASQQSAQERVAQGQVARRRVAARRVYGQRAEARQWWKLVIVFRRSKTCYGAP